MPLHDVNPLMIEPVSLNFAKAFLRIDTEDEDGLISALITASRLRVEALTGLSLLRRRQVETRLNPGQVLTLNARPVHDIHRVSWVSEIDETTDISPQDYSVSLKTGRAKIHFSAKAVSQICTAVEVELSAGFGVSEDDVPMPLRQAILLLVAQSFEHRDKVDQPPVPFMVDALLMPYREVHL